MRALAKKRGLSLSQHGIRKDVVRIKGVKVHDGHLIDEDLTSEKAIFEFFDLKYLEPWERNLA